MPRKVSRGKTKGRITIHFLLTIWDPGDPGGEGFDSEGWRSVSNLQDAIAREMSKQITIENMTLDLNDGTNSIEYGMLNEERPTPDLGPFYIGYMTVSFTYPVASLQTYGKGKSLLD